MPWTIVEDLFYTVWATDDFFYVPESSHWAEDDFFYIPEETVWADDDFFYVPDPIDWGPDWQRFYFPEQYWLLPLTINFDYVKSTANYEELAVLPEDLNIVPEQVQFRRTEWSQDEDNDEDGSWSIRNT